MITKIVLENQKKIVETICVMAMTYIDEVILARESGAFS